MNIFVTVREVFGAGLYRGKQVQEERWGSCHWTKDTNSAKWGGKESDRYRRVDSVQLVWTTPKQKLKKKKSARLSGGALRIILIWWAARPQTPRHVASGTFVLDSSYYIFIHLCSYFLYKYFFSTFCLHKNTTSKQMLKEKPNDGSWHLTRTVTMDLLLCTLSHVWCRLPAAGFSSVDLNADGLYIF